MRYDLFETTMLILPTQASIPVRVYVCMKILKAVEFSEICVKNNTNKYYLKVPHLLLRRYDLSATTILNDYPHHSGIIFS